MSHSAEAPRAEGHDKQRERERETQEEVKLAPACGVSSLELSSHTSRSQSRGPTSG